MPVATPKGYLWGCLGCYTVNVSKGRRRINTAGTLADRDALLKHEDELRDETVGERRRGHRTFGGRSVA